MGINLLKKLSSILLTKTAVTGPAWGGNLPLRPYFSRTYTGKDPTHKEVLDPAPTLHCVYQTPTLRAQHLPHRSSRKGGTFGSWAFRVRRITVRYNRMTCIISQCSMPLLIFPTGFLHPGMRSWRVGVWTACRSCACSWLSGNEEVENDETNNVRRGGGCAALMKKSSRFVLHFAGGKVECSMLCTRV